MRNKTNATQNPTLRITPTAPWRVLKVYPLDGYRLRVCFIDETEGYVDMSNLIIGSNAGVFAKLRDKNIFDKVFIDYGVVTWPGEIDLAPDAMYDEIKKHGEWILS